MHSFVCSGKLLLCLALRSSSCRTTSTIYFPILFLELARNVLSVEANNGAITSHPLILSLLQKQNDDGKN